MKIILPLCNRLFVAVEVARSLIAVSCCQWLDAKLRNIAVGSFQVLICQGAPVKLRDLRPQGIYVIWDSRGAIRKHPAALQAEELRGNQLLKLYCRYPHRHTVHSLITLGTLVTVPFVQVVVYVCICVASPQEVGRSVQQDEEWPQSVFTTAQLFPQKSCLDLIDQPDLFLSLTFSNVNQTPASTQIPSLVTTPAYPKLSPNHVGNRHQVGCPPTKLATVLFYYAIKRQYASNILAKRKKGAKIKV